MSILASFWKSEACGQTVLPDRSFLMGQKLVENAKIKSFDATFWVFSNNIQYIVQNLTLISTFKYWKFGSLRFFVNSNHCGMLELPQKIVFLMVYWWWWVCDVSTKNGPHKLVFFLLVIGGAILLSASKIFAWDYVKHGRKDTTSKVQLCIKDHLSSTKCLEFPEQIFQNSLDHKVFDIMRSTRGWNDKLLAAVSHQSNDIKTKTKR